ncbi:MAG: carbohydrate kinase family protein [Planctomycetia bacterium]|nr:carbohydrate kinase family protein [Planctomycetia bacterium]
MPKVIAAGHLCLDIIPDLSRLKTESETGNFIEPGHLLRIGPASVALGGAVSNTGIALARLGTPVELMGKVGDDVFGKTILEVFRSQQNDLLDFTSGMIVAPGEHSSYSLVVGTPGMDRCFLHCSGANDTFSPQDLHLEKMAGSTLLHFGYPTLMKEILSHPKEFAARLSEIRKQGLLISLDVSMPDPQGPEGNLDWKNWFDIVLPMVDIFLPSLEEMLFMLNRPLFDEISRRVARVVVGQGESVNPARFMKFEQITELADALLQRGVEIAGIKLGDQGLYLRTGENVARTTSSLSPKTTASWKNRSLLAPCFDVPVAGTTGSGDCTIAGFLTGLLNRWEPEKTLRFAVGVGACNVQTPDATSGIPTRDAVLARMKTWKRKPTLFPDVPGC